MMELTKTEEAKANCVAENIIKGLCIGGAKFFKGTGYVLEKSTGVTAAALQATACAIEKGGKVNSEFCYDKADKLNARANKAEEAIESLKASIESVETEDKAVHVNKLGFRPTGATV